MESRVFPPVDGSVTLPEAIDFHAKHNPTHPLYVFSEDGKPDVTTVTNLEFGRATDRVSHHVRPGRAGPDNQVIALVAHSDTLLYQALTLGIIRAGFIPYPMSPRNTAAATIKLMKDSSAHRLLTTRETLQPFVNEIMSELSKEKTPYEISIEEAPAFGQIFPKLGNEKSEDPFEEYPKGSRPPLDDTMLYLHSSGSTGLPKTIRHTYRSLVNWASFSTITEIRDHRPMIKLAAMALPPFHTLAIGIHLLVGLYAMAPIALYPPTATTPSAQPMKITPGNILDHTVRTGSNSLMVLPALFQLWAQDQNAIDTLAKLKFVVRLHPSSPGSTLT
jgi:acyl-CoA synthetase (AMP-forming)/AMP-acid ligase II